MKRINNHKKVLKLHGNNITMSKHHENIVLLFKIHKEKE